MTSNRPATTDRWDGEAYSLGGVQQRAWGMQLIDRLEPLAGESVLDLGCGDGRLTAEIARRVGPDGFVLGLDPSPSMIAAARRAALPNQGFLLAPAEGLDGETQFDAVFSNAVLHWVRDHGRVMARVYCALRPAGRFLAEFGGSGNCGEFFALADALALGPYHPYYSGPPKAVNRYATAAEFSAVMSAAGFRRRRVALRPRLARFGSRENAEHWFRSVGHPYLAPLPPQHHPEFIGRLFDAYGSRPNIRAGRWTVRFMRLIAEGQKAG